MQESRDFKISCPNLDALAVAFLLDVNYEDYVEIVEEFSPEDLFSEKVICIGGSEHQEAPMKKMNFIKQNEEVSSITSYLWMVLSSYYNLYGYSDKINNELIAQGEIVNKHIPYWLQELLVSIKYNGKLFGLERLNYIFASELVRYVDVCSLSCKESGKKNLKSFFIELEELEDLRIKHEVNVCRIDQVPLGYDLARLSVKQIAESEKISPEDIEKLVESRAKISVPNLGFV